VGLYGESVRSSANLRKESIVTALKAPSMFVRVKESYQNKEALLEKIASSQPKNLL